MRATVPRRTTQATPPPDPENTTVPMRSSNTRPAPLEAVARNAVTGVGRPLVDVGHPDVKGHAAHLEEQAHHKQGQPESEEHADLARLQRAREHVK